ncbi:hypothetical protein ASU31_10555 [Pedobacter ginsenosidimutans]|uniref:Conjugal transfer protein TraF n=1 Tax=Pedobacter ginsenosidimutans TaxID=687842 RepID=A0A0T5VQ06_9SPHI|nr:DUF4133 domain-containing protein [Pedobacter ginsenosidimutans]KRT15942.1 hypothetical protein ASU31_10555 [Pedobacter ginsenosidimutans]
MGIVYQINKGVGKPIEFRGLQGQYIAYLAVGLVVLLLLFTGLYLLGTPLVALLPLVMGLGAALFFGVFALSKRFGVHGLAKFMARRGIPVYLKFSSRRVFTGLRVLQGNKERQARR